MDLTSKTLLEIKERLNNLGKGLEERVSKKEYDKLLEDYWKEAKLRIKLEKENKELKESVENYKFLLEEAMEKIDELLEVLENKKNKIAELEIMKYKSNNKQITSKKCDKTININIY